MWSAVLTRLEVILAAIAVLAAVKSAYNGTISGLVGNIREIPPMREKVEQMGDKQDEMIDGMVALSIAESDENTSVDTTRLAQDLRDGASYRVYLNQNGGPQNPYADVEDEEASVEGDREIPEEEARWRRQYDDD